MSDNKTEQPKEVKQPEKVEQPKEVTEKEYLTIYERLSFLVIKKTNNPNGMTEAELKELEELASISKTYKKGAFGKKAQILHVDTQKMYLDPKYRLPQTYVDLIKSKKGVKKEQYLK